MYKGIPDLFVRIVRTLALFLVLSTAFEASADTYTIVRGDTLSKIAQVFSTSVKALADANNIADPDLIFAGDTLNIPVTATKNIAQKKVIAEDREMHEGTIELVNNDDCDPLALLRRMHFPTDVEAHFTDTIIRARGQFAERGIAVTHGDLRFTFTLFPGCIAAHTSTAHAASLNTLDVAAEDEAVARESATGNTALSPWSLANLSAGPNLANEDTQMELASIRNELADAMGDSWQTTLLAMIIHHHRHKRQVRIDDLMRTLPPDLSIADPASHEEEHAWNEKLH